ncbi:MAG: glycosyltransferase family 4 protein [bacterium]|nr:glycosyltransferase family 4 protein [bacterium]
MKKIVTIITKLEFGGAQKIALYSANNLGKGFESYFISGEIGILDKDKKKKYSNIKQFFNIRQMHREIKILDDLRSFIALIILLKKIKPAVVHTHSPKAGLIARWAAFFAGVPKIVHTHHGFGLALTLSRKLQFFYFLLEKMNTLITDQLIFVSEGNFNYAIKNKIANKKKSVIIHCGIDLEAYGKKNTKKIKTKGPVTIGVIACFKKVKAPLDIVRVAACMKQMNTEFVIIGDGELRAEIEEEVIKLGVSDKIKLLGWQDNIPEILETFNIFLLTSLSEGLPLALLEAMASSLPIVATNIQGIRDLIISNENGFLVEPHDISGFVEKITLLLNNQHLQEKFIKNSLAILTDKFDQRRMVRKVLQVYQGGNNV